MGRLPAVVQWVFVAGIGGWFVLLVALERLWPLRQPRRSLGHRVLVNVVLSSLAIGAGAALVKPVALALSQWATAAPFGLLALLPLPAAVHIVASMLALDLSFYYWHRANHELPFLWRFHDAHHIDPDLDVTTALRFHAGEVGLSVGFRAVQVTLLGITPLTLAIYEVVFQAATLFHHTNVRLALRGERMLNRIFVTPRMHGIHHSAVQQETNSNYSVVFSWWDRLHRSLRLNVPQAQIRIGVPAYQEVQDNRLWQVLKLPFVGQRDYWREADGTLARRDPAPLDTAPTNMAP